MRKPKKMAIPAKRQLIPGGFNRAIDDIINKYYPDLKIFFYQPLEPVPAADPAVVQQAAQQLLLKQWNC